MTIDSEHRHGIRLTHQTLTALSLMLAGCGGAWPISSLGADQVWTRPGTAATLQDTLSPIAPNVPFALSNGCSLTPETVVALTDGASPLVQAHNALQSTGDAPTLSGPASAWVQQPSDINESVTLLTTTSVDARAQGGADFSSSLSMSAHAGGSYTEASFLVVNPRRRVDLTQPAEDCMRAFICDRLVNHSPPGTDQEGQSGRYIVSVLYGASVFLQLQSATVQAGAEGAAEQAHVAFDLDTQHVDLRGGIIGRLSGFLNTRDEIRRVYDVPQIISDLQARNTITVASRLDQMTQRYGVVGARLRTVTRSECAAQ